jgi:phosphoribosyl 1,2-cyclic phosphodiesterase
MDRFTVRFWGVRGSLATAGADFVGVGGNTSCVEVRVGAEIIILDAGTGVFPLGQSLGADVRATFLLSHLHWDHIQGFPFFRPAYVAGNAFTLYGPSTDGRALATAFERQMAAPHFPVGLDVLAAHLDFRAIRSGDEIRIGPARVRAAALNHPQGCLGYRISVDDASLVYATDTEPRESGRVDGALLELVRGTDLLIFDAQYTDDEYVGRTGPPRKGWGHSTITEACRVARAGDVRQLALFHHDPTHDDARMDEILRGARTLFLNTITAREGVVLRLDHDAERSRRRASRHATSPTAADTLEASDMACAQHPQR